MILNDLIGEQFVFQCIIKNTKGLGISILNHFLIMITAIVNQV